MSSDTSENPLDFFRVKAAEANSDISRANALRAIDALAKFTGGADIGFDSFDSEMLGEWVSRLLFLGYTPKTISNNILKRLATLYNKAVEAGLAQPNDLFRHFQTKLNDDSANAIDTGAGPDTFGRIQSIVRADYHANPVKRLAQDILLFSIFMGGMGFGEIANFKKGDYKGDNECILEIVRRYSRPRNKYLFTLNRTHSTPRQLDRRIESLMHEILSGLGLNLSANPSDTSFSLWALAAMGCGVSSADIAACIPAERRGCTVTAMAHPSDIDDDRKTEIRNLVAATLNDNPPRWFAMHLRRNADYDMLTRRLKEKDITLDEIYYPLEEIVRRTGRRNVFENRPVISWLLFFRERVTNLGGLFNEIGDLAWCYRYTNDVRSQYAVISDDEIMQYQTTLGTLTPQTPIVADGDVTVNEGDCLVILGGALNGRHAIFVEQKKAPRGKDGGKIIFRVRLGGGTNANWTVDWDPRLVRKITASQYRELDTLYRRHLDAL